MKYNGIMLILAIILAMLLIVIAAARPVTVGLSRFEFKRRESKGLLSDLEVKRGRYAGVVRSLVELKSTAILLILVVLLVVVFEWWIGALVGLFIGIVYKFVANLKPIKSVAAKLYSYYEVHLLNIFTKAPRMASFLESLGGDNRQDDQSVKINSRAELRDMLRHSSGVFSAEEEVLIKKSLTFNRKKVSDIMTPRESIISIGHDELLGPVILSELHSKGHNWFPVTRGDIDNIVGILQLDGVLKVDSDSNSQKTSRAMHETVEYVAEDQTLRQALTTCLDTKSYMLIVRDKSSKTVGLITLEDILSELFGRNLID